MKTNNNNTGADIFTDAELIALFDAKEAGKEFAEALQSLDIADASPQVIREAKHFWDMHGMLAASAARVSPNPQFTERMATAISALPATVTRSPYFGYNRGSAQDARFITHNLQQLMEINWKFVAPVAVVVLLLVAVVHKGNTPESAPLAVDMQAPTLVVTPEPAPAASAVSAKSAAPVTGDVDDLLASLSAEADADAVALDDANDDIAMAGTDSQEINDITTSYDETTF